MYIKGNCELLKNCKQNTNLVKYDLFILYVKIRTNLVLEFVFCVLHLRVVEKLSVRRVKVIFPASRGPFSFVFAELTDGTKRDLCHGSKLPLIQPPSMVVDGGFRNACSLYCLLTVT